MSGVANEVLDHRLRRLTRLCAALPETQCALADSHATFRVRGKVFVYFLSNHHGDGIVSVCCKSSLGENVDRASSAPERYYLPAYIGPRGWFGLRLDQGAIDWQEVENVVELSYRLVAPRTLLRALDARKAPTATRKSSLPSGERRGRNATQKAPGRLSRRATRRPTR